jgi:hypothetical protein
MADELNFQIPQQGFDSYLYGIIPDDQAVLAGAFGVSMQQIRNIEKVNAQDFAQVVYNIENMAGLPFTSGTDIPTDLQLASFAKSRTALGSGIYGTFTHSNFFGCMSGLPYPLETIYNSIKQLETQTLTSIYQNLYLAVTWDAPGQGTPGTFTAQYETRTVETLPSVFVTEYRYTGVSFTDGGGGYGRGGASAPSIVVSNDGGATTTVTIGTDPDNFSTFGKITSITVSGASWQLTAPSFSSIQYPPNTYPGGSNSDYGTSGWPGMNTIIQNYVDAANNEIQSIKQASVSNFTASQVLDACWNITGTALKQEQRARNNFAAPIPIPYDRWLNISPTALYVFVDSIPELAKQTEPHMAAQTLEHISNLKNIGGQSVVGMMRQERNQDRLQQVGIDLDNNILDRLSVQIQRMLMTNGTVPGAVDGVPSQTGIDYTIPSNPATEIVTGGSPCDLSVTTEIGGPIPIAIFDPNTQELRQITATKDGNILAILQNACLGPKGNGTGPVIIINGNLPPGLPAPSSFCGEPAPDELVVEPCVNNNGEIPVVMVNPKVPAGETPILDITPGILIRPDSPLLGGGPVEGIPSGDPNQPSVPGTGGPGGPGQSIGPNGSTGISINPQTPTRNSDLPDPVIPVNLNTAYTGTTLLPSTYDVNDAIDKVIECNCDCWID